MNNNYTPLPGVKWTRSSLIKTNNAMWSRFLKFMLDDSKLSKEEKNKRINETLKYVKHVHGLILDNEINFKKSN